MLIALGVLHLVVLGWDAGAQARGWVVGELWTWAHWGPVASQDRTLVLSGFGFWSTVGSFAFPLIVLGALLLRLDRQGVAAPRFIAVSIVVWLAVSSLLMPPSGFPLAAVTALGLVFARRTGDDAVR